ncbi:MAG TPA: hypothetical protein VFJ16_24485 [Longimicrobium sp.]|nr:hypothetical protein [Longimicrobium sp.]
MLVLPAVYRILLVTIAAQEPEALKRVADTVEVDPDLPRQPPELGKHCADLARAWLRFGAGLLPPRVHSGQANR